MSSFVVRSYPLSRLGQQFGVCERRTAVALAHAAPSLFPPPLALLRAVPQAWENQSGGSTVSNSRGVHQQLRGGQTWDAGLWFGKPRSALQGLG